MVSNMANSKQNSQFIKLQREIYKKLSELEFEVKQPDLRKKITLLIDKIYNLKPLQNSKVVASCEEIINYIKELKNEMINPIDLIINNYIDKIDSLLNKLKFESEG